MGCDGGGPGGGAWFITERRRDTKVDVEVGTMGPPTASWFGQARDGCTMGMGWV